jgi:hypothetical protein
MEIDKRKTRICRALQRPTKQVMNALLTKIFVNPSLVLLQAIRLDSEGDQEGSQKSSNEVQRDLRRVGHYEAITNILEKLLSSGSKFGEPPGDVNGPHTMMRIPRQRQRQLAPLIPTNIHIYLICCL